ncbi:hypothetical protein N7535_008498 [Penicillium sp. DV-2018c]|nr:hypothetical protein N7461_002257 [Penicillium sp. DV-2018c]KAJ5563334.1 hypothetical protein N7535_008498 [Penicillium sp. DV-2018c]
MAQNWRESTPPPHPETQRIKDRQAELSALFQKIGQAQQGALAVVADRSMDTLARDPDSHKNCPEFATVQQDLDWYEARAVGILEAQCREKCLLAERMREADVWIAEKTADYDVSDSGDSFQPLVFPDDDTLPGQLEGGFVAEEAYESLLEAAKYIHTEQSAGKPIRYE